MKLHKNIPITIADKEERAEVEEYTRGGWKSPTMYIIKYKGKTYVPKAQRIHKINITLGGLFKLVYSDHVKDLVGVYKNPFLSYLK